VSELLKPFVDFEDVTVHFPMHLDERSRSFRWILSNAVRFKNERRRYHYGLHRVNLTAKPGDKIGIVGRNGAGKTTLLRTLAGIYEPDMGRVTRVGKTVPLINLSMGMDMYASGVRNVELRGTLYGMDHSEIEETIKDVRAFSELGSFLDEPIRTYSSGMLARLSFAIATAVKADIILMDEWISAGDKRFVDRAEKRMEDMLRNDRIVFLASHSAALVRKWCNRILVIDGGKILYDDPDVSGGIVFLNELLESAGRNQEGDTPQP